MIFKLKSTIRVYDWFNGTCILLQEECIVYDGDRQLMKRGNGVVQHKVNPSGMWSERQTRNQTGRPTCRQAEKQASMQANGPVG